MATRGTRSIAVAAILLTLAGCNPWRKKPKPVVYPPDAQLNVEQFAGTALSGPQTKPPADSAYADAWGISARIIAVDKMPEADFTLVGPQARLVIGQNPSDVLAPTSQLIYATRALWLKTGDSLEGYLNANGNWDELRSLRGATVLGSTTSLEIALPVDAEKTVTFTRRKVRIEVSRTQAGDGYELALASDDLVPPNLTPAQEKIVLNRWLSADADRVAIAVPMPFPQSATRALVIDLVVTRKANADLTAAAKTQIAVSAASAQQRAKLKPASPEEADIAAALDAINSQPPNRGAMAFLAEETGAVLTKNVVLAADDAVLPMIAGEIRTRSQKLAQTDKNTVGWMLDRATIAAIGSIKEEEGSKLLPAIQGVLINYAGEVGRQFDLLQSVAAQSVNSRDLDAHIIAEHRIALEDTSPALRVRAYDWLNERGMGPANYDPLGSPRARRAAIEKYNEATTQPAGQSTDTPSTQPAQASTQPTTDSSDDSATTQPSTQP